MVRTNAHFGGIQMPVQVGHCRVVCEPDVRTNLSSQNVLTSLQKLKTEMLALEEEVKKLESQATYTTMQVNTLDSEITNIINQAFP